MSFSRRTRDFGKRMLFRFFRVGQRLGVDVLPRHFYSSVPDIRELTASEEWRAPSDMPGVAGSDVEAQIAEARAWFTDDVSKALNETNVHADACKENGADGYGPMEAQFLHAFIATRRPRRVVQVGAGVDHGGDPRRCQAPRRRCRCDCRRPLPDAAAREAGC